ncbi:hypothetical protein GUJ93_ZPchr0013g37905 [Zizania palustris]|uniref:X8 domain-containing protein n=1 Tax=Zizania palustris TaxID=103762 RepID=A0A8J6C0A0_ZIZPA|nr:hypothetical protein GUJ93_ZPchr0013g37905 [Zizania palustris]
MATVGSGEGGSCSKRWLGRRLQRGPVMEATIVGPARATAAAGSAREVAAAGAGEEDGWADEEDGCSEGRRLGIVGSFPPLRAPNRWACTMQQIASSGAHVRREEGKSKRYVAVGNEPFLESYHGSFIKTTFPALQNIQKALDDAGIGDRIKATVPLNADVYKSPRDNPVPSAGRFSSHIAGLMTDIVKFLAKNNAPFTVNIYPFLSLYLDEHFPLDFAFFDGNATPVNDGGILYTNVFDANFDTLVAALKAVGHGDMPIIVGEVGWPTDGDKNAKASYAQRFYGGLLNRLAAKAGTPARPNQHIEVYLFGLVDEDKKSVEPGNFERHWGILRYDGQPKFAMDLTGQGRNTMLVPAKGIEYLSKTWCVLNAKAKDLNKLGANIDFACSNADCTSLGLGSTCHGMDAMGNASYAFNAYFQAQSQKDEACGFQGLALPTETDPSTAACNFTIQIKSSAAPAISGVPVTTAVLMAAATQLLLL